MKIIFSKYELNPASLTVANVMYFKVVFVFSCTQNSGHIHAQNSLSERALVLVWLVVVLVLSLKLSFQLLLSSVVCAVVLYLLNNIHLFVQ